MFVVVVHLGDLVNRTPTDGRERRPHRVAYRWQASECGKAPAEARASA